ncbi:unnamed protein product [Rotaria sp. Silwood1]|nr:unnamed protein product [Rotaria sp. Silwood1]
MSLKRKMIDTATGASPPGPSTREMASSPIKFRSSMEMIASDDFHDCSTTINLGRCNIKEPIAMNEMNNQQLTSPFPSPTTDESNNNTPVLSSITSSKPVPLMSIGMNEHRVDSISDSSAATNIINKKNGMNRYWPVDPVYRYNIRNHQQKIQNHRRYKSHHYQRRFYCRQCADCANRKPQAITSGNSLRPFSN